MASHSFSMATGTREPRSRSATCCGRAPWRRPLVEPLLGAEGVGSGAATCSSRPPLLTRGYIAAGGNGCSWPRGGAHAHPTERRRTARRTGSSPSTGARRTRRRTVCRMCPLASWSATPSRESPHAVQDDSHGEKLASRSCWFVAPKTAKNADAMPHPSMMASSRRTYMSIIFAMATCRSKRPCLNTFDGASRRCGRP